MPTSLNTQRRAFANGGAVTVPMAAAFVAYQTLATALRRRFVDAALADQEPPAADGLLATAYAALSEALGEPSSPDIRELDASTATGSWVATEITTDAAIDLAGAMFRWRQEHGTGGDPMETEPASQAVAQVASALRNLSGMPAATARALALTALERLTSAPAF